MFKVGMVLVTLALATVPPPANDDWTFAGRDCRPWACRLDEGALRMCAAAGQDKRLYLEDLPEPRTTYARFTWDPGSLAAARALQVHFRWGAAESHRVTFDPADGVVRVDGGLPPMEARFAFGLRDHAIEVVHSHRLKVYIDGVDDAHLVLDAPLAEADQLATRVVLQAFDDGTCHRFREIGGVPYAWDCLAGRCEVDAWGLQLCSWGTTRLRWLRPVTDGAFAFAWNPVDDASVSMTVALRADAPAGERHTVTFDLLRGAVRFGEGLLGLHAPLDLESGPNRIQVTHGTNDLGVGEVRLYVNDMAIPSGLATYHRVGAAATMLEFEAVNGWGGCHWISELAAPSG